MDFELKYDPTQRISVAIDCIIFGFDSNRLKLLLFKRRIEPLRGRWSLIGALTENDVSLDDGAKQILYESTGLKDIYLRQFKTYGAVDRDPYERVISVAYFSLIRIREYDDEKLESYEAKWFDLYNLPELIMDHQQMVLDAIELLRWQARYRPIGFELLPEYFTLPQLQILYENIYGTQFDPRNFRKKILSLKILEKTESKDKSGSRKGAFLYRFVKQPREENNLDSGDFSTISGVIQF